jgi:ABC-2 type transport system permease protein
MISNFFRLAIRQMDVQLRMRVLSLWSLGLLFVQPAIFSAIGMLLARAAGNANPDLIYTVLGGGIMGMWSGLVFTSTYDIRADRREGTLELIVGSPTPLRRVVGFRSLLNILAGSTSMIAAVAAAIFIFDYSFSVIHTPGVIIAFLLLLFGLWCMGIFLANMLAWSRLSGTFVDLLEMPIALLCGFMYPISILPVWMQQISAVFPIRWALEALRESMRGAPVDRSLTTSWLISLGISLVFLMVARWFDGKVHDHIRVTGELHSI